MYWYDFNGTLSFRHGLKVHRPTMQSSMSIQHCHTLTILQPIQMLNAFLATWYIQYFELSYKQFRYERNCIFTSSIINSSIKISCSSVHQLVVWRSAIALDCPLKDLVRSCHLLPCKWVSEKQKCSFAANRGSSVLITILRFIIWIVHCWHLKCRWIYVLNQKQYNTQNTLS